MNRLSRLLWEVSLHSADSSCFIGMVIHPLYISHVPFHNSWTVECRRVLWEVSMHLVDSSVSMCTLISWCASYEHYQGLLLGAVCTAWPCSLWIALCVPTPIQHALQKCHEAQAKGPAVRSSRVKVKGGRVCRVPGGTMKILAAKCSQHHLADDVLFEPLSKGTMVLPKYFPEVNGENLWDQHCQSLLLYLDVVVVVVNIRCWGPQQLEDQCTLLPLWTPLTR